MDALLKCTELLGGCFDIVFLLTSVSLEGGDDIISVEGVESLVCYNGKGEYLNKGE